MSNHAPRHRWLAGWRPRNLAARNPAARNPAARNPAAAAHPSGLAGNGLPIFVRGLRLPAWLVSVVLHVLILLALAAWSFSAVSPPPMISIQGAAPAMEDELQHLTLEAPLVDLPDVAPPVPPVRSLSAADLSVEVGPASVALQDADSQPPTVSLASEIGRMVDSRMLREPAAGGMAGRAEFFGVQAAGRRFVFVVDSSRSMRGSRFVAARQELAQAIRRLSPQQYFYVIFFDQEPERMVLPPDTTPPPRLVPATPQNVLRLERWLAGVELQSGADPRQALEWAVEMLPDAVFLLSDGEFGAATEEWLEQHNYRDDAELGRVPRVVLHTVGLQSRGGEQRLQRIATQFGGSYRFVPAPPSNR